MSGTEHGQVLEDMKKQYCAGVFEGVEKVLTLEHEFLKALLGLRENDVLLVQNRDYRCVPKHEYTTARQLLCTCSMVPLTVAVAEPIPVTSPGPVQVEMRLSRMVTEHHESEVRYYQGRCKECRRVYVADVRVEWQDGS